MYMQVRTRSLCGLPKSRTCAILRTPERLAPCLAEKFRVGKPRWGRNLRNCAPQKTLQSGGLDIGIFKSGQADSMLIRNICLCMRQCLRISNHGCVYLILVRALAQPRSSTSWCCRRLSLPSLKATFDLACPNLKPFELDTHFSKCTWVPNLPDQLQVLRCPGCLQSRTRARTLFRNRYFRNQTKDPKTLELESSQTHPSDNSPDASPHRSFRNSITGSFGFDPSWCAFGEICLLCSNLKAHLFWKSSAVKKCIVCV
jgi:hypothetical protein